jgi:hypothetical protein
VHIQSKFAHIPEIRGQASIQRGGGALDENLCVCVCVCVCVPWMINLCVCVCVFCYVPGKICLKCTVFCQKKACSVADVYDVYVRIFFYVCIYTIHTYLYTCTCMLAPCMSASNEWSDVFVCMCLRTYQCMYVDNDFLWDISIIYVCMYASMMCMYLCMYVCMYVYVCVCVCIYIHTYVYVK